MKAKSLIFIFIILITFVSCKWFETKGEEYSNNQYGFKINAPKGWYIHKNPNQKALVFINEDQNSADKLPAIGVSIDFLNPNRPTLSTFAQMVVSLYQGKGFKTEDLVEIQVGDIKGYYFSAESPIGKAGYSIKLLQHLFEKEGKVISVMYSGKTSDVDQSTKFYNETVKTLKYFEPPTKTSYQCENPRFEISIPKNFNDWTIVDTQNRTKPIMFFKKGSEGPPFIDSYVSFSNEMPEEIRNIWSNPEMLFASVTDYHKKYERETFPDIEFLIDKRIDLVGRPALDRVYRSAKTGVTYHSIYVLFDTALVTFGLNSDTNNYEKYDKEFISVINTLRVTK
jgi:hypothetical protein